MNHTELADALNLERAEVEWAFTVFGIVQSLYDLTFDERTQVLIDLCGASPVTEPIKDWSKEYTSLWEVHSNLSVLRWLVLGLDDSSSTRISDSLEQIRNTRSERISVNALSIDEPIGNPPERIMLIQPQGFMILRIYDGNQGKWHYHTFSQPSYCSVDSLNEERTLIQEIVTTSKLSASIPVTLIAIEHHLPAKTPSLNSHLSTESFLESQQCFSSRLMQLMTHDSLGDFFHTDSTMPSSASLKHGWQHTLQWNVSSTLIQGAEYPMIWNLTQHINQRVSGHAGRNGSLQVRNSVFSQIVSNHDTWLCGTNSDRQPHPFPKAIETRADSQRCIWQTPYSAIDFLNAATHIRSEVQPLFNTFSKVEQCIEKSYFVRGIGNHLQGQTFVEMMLQAEQPDDSRRTQISLQNDTFISVLGDLEWCGNTISITPDMNDPHLIWTHGTDKRSINYSATL